VVNDSKQSGQRGCWERVELREDCLVGNLKLQAPLS
jgi:hypothetical protein